jgi:hypothetical protein
MFHRNTFIWLDEDSIDLQIEYSSLPFEENDVNELFSIELIELFNKDNLLIDDKFVEFNNQVTAEHISNKIGMGWNLGNTLDAYDHNQGLKS